MNKILYRIHTESKPNLGSVVCAFFDCFAIQPVIGYWQGQREEGATVEIIGDRDDAPKVVRAAQAICDLNKQEAVYVTTMRVGLTDVRPETVTIRAGMDRVAINPARMN